MAQRDRERIRSSLTSKGFIEENNDHYFYSLIYQNKKTAIFTKLSKGSNYKTIQQKLLSLMSRQLKLSNHEFLELIDCEMTGEQYVQILKDKKILK
jgi:hypothetical protein